MVEITLQEWALIGAFLLAVVLGFFAYPRVTRHLIRKGVEDKDDPLRKAYGTVFREDFLPEVVQTVRGVLADAIAPLSRKLQDLDDQRIRAEEKFEGLRLEITNITRDLAPLLATFQVQGEDGKPEAVNQIVAALSAVQRAADAALQATYIELEVEPGKKEFVPIGPNLDTILDRALLRFKASEEASAMGTLSSWKRDAQTTVDAQTIAEYATQLQDPNVRAQLAQGAELKEMEDLARDLLVGDGTKKGMMTEARFNRAIALAKKRGNIEQFLGGATGQGGGQPGAGKPSKLGF